jgi:hypothetical protein
VANVHLLAARAEATIATKKGELSGWGLFEGCDGCPCLT